MTDPLARLVAAVEAFHESFRVAATMPEEQATRDIDLDVMQLHAQMVRALNEYKAATPTDADVEAFLKRLVCGADNGLCVYTYDDPERERICREAATLLAAWRGR